MEGARGVREEWETPGGGAGEVGREGGGEAVDGEVGGGDAGGRGGAVVGLVGDGCRERRGQGEKKGRR